MNTFTKTEVFLSVFVQKRSSVNGALLEESSMIMYYGTRSQASFRAYSFGHLLKKVELVENKIPFFWYPSTENGRLRRLEMAFHKSPFSWSFCFR